jgi:chromosome segregation ATPase
MRNTVVKLSLNNIVPDRFLTLRPVFISIALALLCSLLTAPVTARPSWGKQRQLSLEEINDRILSLQSKVDSLIRLQSNLRQDSSRIKQESSQQSSAISRKKAEVDEALAKKKITAGGISSQYEKAKQDSAEIVSAIRGKMAELHKEIVKLESTIITMSNELEVLSQRRDQLDAPASAADQKTISRLQAQIARNDSLIKARQEAFPQLSAQREKFRKDSLSEENKLDGARQDFHQQLSLIDKTLSPIEAAIAQVEQKQALDKGENDKKITDMKASIAALIAQKKAITEKKAVVEAEITKLNSEKQRLIQSATTAQQRYKQLRAPFEKALADAEDALESALTEKKNLTAVRQKLRLDSSISKARDALDLAIQGEAERKRGAKKLVELREKALNELLNVLDGTLQNNPGIKQKEASFNAPSASQRSGMVADALVAADKQVSVATANRDKAKKNLTDFDAKNPPPADPAGPRMDTIDNLLSVRKKNAIQYTEQIDSIFMVSQDLQTSLSSQVKSLQGEIGKGDSVLQSKKREKTSLASKRAKIVKDSIQNETTNAGALTRIKTGLAGFGGKQIALQNEITALIAERDKAKKTLSATQEKARQAQLSQKTEKKKTDSLISAKQQDITLISMKSEKLRQDSISLTRKMAQQIQSLNPPPSSFGNQLAVLEKEVAVIQARSDSLKRALQVAEATPAEKSRAISTEIAAISRSITATENELAAMKKEKTAAFERLKKDEGKYDSLVRVTEQDLAAAIAKRDKARQDSAAAEIGVRQASQKLQNDVKELDNIVAAHQKELDALTLDAKKIKEDSVKIAEKIPSALQALSQPIKNIDVLIAAKEKELAELNARRDRAKQDSIEERKRLYSQLAAAYEEIVKNNAVVSKKKAEISLSQANKKKIQTDTTAYKQKAKQALVSATEEVQRQNALINTKKTDLARLQKELDEIASYVKDSGSEKGTITIIEPRPAPAPTFSPSSAATATPTQAPVSKGTSTQAPTAAEIAQLQSEELYNMLADNKIYEAAKRFRQLQGFLKANLDSDAFQTLKVTIEQMGGSVN